MKNQHSIFFSVVTYCAQWVNPEHTYHMVEETCNTKINNGNEMIENCIFHAKKVEKKKWKLEVLYYYIRGAH